MSLLKRLSTTVTARLDQAVSHIENHDAVAESVIRQIRREVATAKVRLVHVNNEGATLRRKLNELITNEQQWKTRACKSAATDEAKALECVRRAQQCQQQVKHFQQTLTQHNQLEQRLSSDIHDAERRLEQLSRQRTSMRTRQSAAQSINGIQRIDDMTAGQLDDVFERWEVSLTESELNAGTYDGGKGIGILGDDLEQTFINEEEEIQLRNALDALIKADTSTKREGDTHE